MSDTLERPRSISRLYKDLWHFAEGKRSAIVLAFALLLGSQILKLLAPWFAGKAINALQSGGLAGLEEAGKWLAGVFAVTAGSWVLHGPGRIVERNIAIRVRERVAGGLLDKLLDAHWRGMSSTTPAKAPIACSKAALRCTICAKSVHLLTEYRPDHRPGAGVVCHFASDWHGCGDWVRCAGSHHLAV